MQINTKAALDQAISFLEKYEETIRDGKKQDAKSILLETLTVILRPLINAPRGKVGL